MAFTDQYNLSCEQAFIQRVGIALVNAAVAVMAEAPTTENHAARVLYAHNVIQNPLGGNRTNAAFVTANNATILQSYITGGMGAVQDSDIAFVVTNQFNALAD